MKYWKCPSCAREHESEDNVKFVVCKGCLSSMEEVEEKEGVKMDEEIKQTMYSNAEDDPFQATPKSSVKLKKTTRGLSWEIKVVTGEESLIDSLMEKAIEVHKKIGGLLK